MAVLITGASSGIGEGFARALAKRGEPLILTARRENRLTALQRELSQHTQVDIIPLDLYQLRSAEQLFQICQERGYHITGLINNAGLGWQKDFACLNEEELNRMLTINLVVLAQLTWRFLPAMLERQSGFILNVASIAGLAPLPHFSLYAATKSFVVSLSEALHEEVQNHGVRVVCLCPGPTRTEFPKVPSLKHHYSDYSQTVKDVVRAGLKALDKNHALAYTSWWQKGLFTALGFLPRKWKIRLGGFSMAWVGAERFEGK